jgi:parvulin-like peptidyl-prolyl isomerase
MSVRKLVLLVVALALLTAACSGSGTEVATVNGTAITLGEVEELRQAGSVANREQFNQDLFQLIVEETVRQAASEDFGIVPVQADIDARFDEFIAGIEAQGPLQEYLDEFEITEETIRHVAFQQVMLPEIQDRLIAEADPIDEEAVRAAYDQQLPALTTICTRHILVATEEEAEEVVERLDGGEEFADLAAELSIDTGSGAAGGDIGCLTEAEMAQSFVPSYTEAARQAPVGEVYEPFESDFGFHVLIVDSRDAPAFEEVSADLEASLAGEQAGLLFDEWVFEVLGEADIVVTERYGTWRTEPTFGVVSPA